MQLFNPLLTVLLLAGRALSKNVILYMDNPVFTYLDHGVPTTDMESWEQGGASVSTSCRGIATTDIPGNGVSLTFTGTSITGYIALYDPSDITLLLNGKVFKGNLTTARADLSSCANFALSTGPIKRGTYNATFVAAGVGNYVVFDHVVYDDGTPSTTTASEVLLTSSQAPWSTAGLPAETPVPTVALSTSSASMRQPWQDTALIGGFIFLLSYFSGFL